MVHNQDLRNVPPSLFPFEDHLTSLTSSNEKNEIVVPQNYKKNFDDFFMHWRPVLKLWRAVDKILEFSIPEFFTEVYKY